MTEPVKDPSGTPIPDPVVSEADKEMARLREHAKILLGEKKKVQDELKAIQDANKLKEDDDLKATNQFKELYEAEKKLHGESADKLLNFEKRQVDARKLRTFLDSLPEGHTVPEKYWNNINVDKIAVDDAGTIDANSVSIYATAFVKEYPELLHTATKPNLPGGAPIPNGSGTLSMEEWKALPTLKEKKARVGELQVKTA
jgi:hypothetical protein